jgi:carbonic anhydrase
LAARLSRRLFLKLSLSTAAASLIVACSSETAPPDRGARPGNADEALARLLDGNQRFVAGEGIAPHPSQADLAELAEGQSPWAIVWGCIDSRVPPEVVFDQGLGDLFVIRTAGQVADAAGTGSVEFGVLEFDVPLIVVLGHETCGAITATIEAVDGRLEPEGDLAYLVEAILPAVEAAGETGDRVDKAVKANVAQQVAALKADPLLAPRIADGRLRVVGAQENLHDGVVEVIVP